MFRIAWPLLLAIHDGVEAGASWDQDWLRAFPRDVELSAKARELLMELSFAPVRQALFTEEGDLKDPAYRIQWPLPQTAVGLEEGWGGLPEAGNLRLNGAVQEIWAEPAEASGAAA